MTNYQEIVIKVHNLGQPRGAQGTHTTLLTTHGWVYAGDSKEEEELQGRRKWVGNCPTCFSQQKL